MSILDVSGASNGNQELEAEKGWGEPIPVKRELSGWVYQPNQGESYDSPN